MNIVLYINNSENNKINKTLTEQGTLTGTLRSECSITNPVIEVQSTELPKFNYIFISEFERYYFVDNIVSVRNNLWRISATVDVLSTYKDYLLSHSALVSRSTSDYNKDIVDVVLPITSQPDSSDYEDSTWARATLGVLLI